MRFYIFLICFPLSIFASDKLYTLKDYEKTPKTLGQVTRLAVKYSRDRLVGYVHDILMAGRPSRFVGSEGHEKARQVIISALKEIDSNDEPTIEKFSLDIDSIKTSYQKDMDEYLASGVLANSNEASSMRQFTQSMLKTIDEAKGFEGQNIIWEKKGFLQPNEVIIVGAHYDTIAQDPKKLLVTSKGAMPGADNNASGVAAALALVEALTQVNIAKTVRVVFFDAEEIGQSGSKAYVTAHKEELSKLKFAGFVNLLMLGHDTVHQDKNNKSGNMRFYTRSPSTDEKGSVADTVFAKELANTGKEIRSSVVFEPTARADVTSSQLAFAKAGFPAIVMTHDWENDFNTAHHTKQDFAETLNFSTFHNATQYLIGAVLAWSFDMR